MLNDISNKGVKLMATRRKMLAVLMCIVVSIMALGCSKEDEFQGDYKLIRIESKDENKRDEEFFEIFEKYNIFYGTLTIEEEGKAYLKSAGSDELYSFSYDEEYFIDPETKKKDRYVFENGEISLRGSSLFGSARMFFKKMTPEESEILKNGFLEEDFHKAEKEADEIISKYIQSLDKSQLSILERTRIATDKSNYDEIAGYAIFVSYNREVEKVLQEGHTYTISFSKNGTVVFLDSKEASADDPFCIELEKRIPDYRDYRVKSQMGGEYFIDVLPDGTVRKTKEPWTYE